MTTTPAAETLPDLLRAGAAADPEREAFVVGGVRLTYAQLNERMDDARRALQGIGVGEGDVVALLAPNDAAWVPVAFGAMAAGARVDAFNTWVKAYDIEYLLTSSKASVLVMVDRVRGNDLVGELRKLVPDLGKPGEVFPELRHVVVLGDAVPDGALAWADLPKPPATPAKADPGEPAFVLYTSGSTKNPKAVPLCHRDLILNGFHIGERMGLSADDRVWFGSPLFWSFGCANALMTTMTHQACFVLQEQFEPRIAAELMAAERVTAAYLLPAMVDALVNGPAERVRAVDSLRTGLTIGRPEEVERAITQLGISEMCNVYGSTETYGNCCVTDHRMPLGTRLSTQGEPLTGVEIRVADQETGALLPAGEPGELQVRGRLTPGYLNDDEANADAFTGDGWFRTGDRGMVNADGTVSFVGRITDMIKTSGINVSPAEVESFLSGHPEVAEAVVLGAPHPSRDEVVVAFVVARGGKLTAQDVIAHCKERIAGYKVPWAVAIVEQLPKTGTGKLVRRTLRDEAEKLVQDKLKAGTP
ncbi:class I adenylate-forming enzyme family protein [Amycolatopsis sp. DSM 110486]|uniref:class I adenylate-forming enzyme family protein n=1 Tax=Amycolatopsis sp. DSM 110486 TaxID=2865832 RepID=UPI001C6A81B2|nr:class I adenylate-forming enzyme family protein [Amycolatopsis sp. DSM 110486]QYN21117.1 acyl--CoA ligase [Amycolatopsis sp. DSM 110486]